MTRSQKTESDSSSSSAAQEDGLSKNDSGATVNGWPANPFVGLRPFEDSEGLLFFGRREQTMEFEMSLLHLPARL